MTNQNAESMGKERALRIFGGPKKVFLPPLHIKLGLIKQFVKTLSKDGDTFKYLTSKFPGLSEAKLKEGILIGPDIRKLVKDELFETKMEDIE